MKKMFFEFFLLNLGALMDAAGFYFFLAPNQIAAGGITGLSLVIRHYFPMVPLGVMVLVMSIILLIIGFIMIGAVFGLKTVYCSLIIPVMIWAMENLFPLHGPLAHDTLLQLIFGVLMSGTGLALLFNQNASSGGTDIIARIINKYHEIDMGKGLLLIDFVITVLASFTFGLAKGMYAMLGVILYSFVIDYVIEGLTVSKHVTIITKCSDVVKKFIVEDIDRGATIYSARGAYTNNQRDVLITIVNRREFVLLRKFIFSHDPDAFVSVQNVHEVLGEGFSSVD